jgi:hypothetical protein
MKLEALRKFLEFNEQEFRRQWSIRGVGMGMPQDAVHHAHCYHRWLCEPVVQQMVKVIEAAKLVDETQNETRLRVGPFRTLNKKLRALDGMVPRE